MSRQPKSILIDSRLSLQMKSGIETFVPILRLAVVLLAVVVVLHSTFARADGTHSMVSNPSAASNTAGLEAGGSATVKVTRDARGRKVQYVDFADAHIEGKAKTPEGFVIQSRRAGKFQSLIELRSHFRDNINIHALEGANGLGTGE
ncbi:hypothetical protein EBU99_05715 [bacterium]|nr:hypothetical protein [bacterium]